MSIMNMYEKAGEVSSTARAMYDSGPSAGVEGRRNAAIFGGLLYIGECIREAIIEAAKILAENKDRE